jgi:uncharacterized protein YuzE
VKLKVDQQADALYLTLGEAPASDSEEVSSGIIVDYDEQGHVVGRCCTCRSGCRKSTRSGCCSNRFLKRVEAGNGNRDRPDRH